MPAATYTLDVDYITPAQIRAWLDEGCTCGGCGEPLEVDVWEYYPEEHAFQVMTCCEGSYEETLEAMEEWTRADWQQWFADSIGLAIRTVHTTVDKTDGLGWQLDLGLEVREITQADAFAFIDRHHEHNERPQGWRFGAAIYNGPTLLGVVTVGRPVSRRIDQTHVVEVTRLCLDRRLSAGLAEHACSKLYAWAAREAEKRGHARIITYTLTSESGTSVQAAGWQRDAATPASKGWSRRTRQRTTPTPTEAKVRWAKTLRPAARAVRALLERTAARRAARARAA